MIKDFVSIRTLLRSNFYILNKLFSMLKYNMTEKIYVRIDPNQSLFTDGRVIKKWENGRSLLSDEDRAEQGFIGSEPLHVLRDKYGGIYKKRIEGLFENIGTTEDEKNKPAERIFLYNGGIERTRLGERRAAGWKISRGDYAYSNVWPWEQL